MVVCVHSRLMREEVWEKGWEALEDSDPMTYMGHASGLSFEYSADIDRILPCFPFIRDRGLHPL